MSNKIIVPIKGMHCRSCELLIEDNLLAVNNVKKVRSNFKSGQAEIFYSQSKPTDQDIEQAVRSAGYEIGHNQPHSFFNHNKSVYQDLLIAAVIFMVLFWLAKALGLVDLNLTSAGANPESLGVVLLVGLTAGFSTCMALVGGIILALSAKHAEVHPEATGKQKFMPHLYFNLGRIVGYAALGGLLGVLGSAFKLSSAVNAAITIAVSLIMLIIGWQLLEIFPWLERFKLTLPKGLARFLGIKQEVKEYRPKSAMLLGALTFFIPCGFTQAMQIYALSTANFIGGALVMGLFALGTAPGLLTIGGLTSLVKGIMAKRFFKLAGLIVIVFALFNINNSLVLLGFKNSALQQPAVKNADIQIENNEQVIRMVENYNGYTPNQLTVKKNIPVKLIIDGQAPYSCAAGFNIPSLGIAKDLNSGENIITFTPTTVGPISFSCSMGMYRGVINVVE